MEDHCFLELEWDYYLVLDACRYDVFSEVYDDYLNGRLEKRRSLRSSTPEWAYRAFIDDPDIAYFSGNPFINDLRIPLNELKWGASCDYKWMAADHISDVFDVWKTGWDDGLGTVSPERLAESFRNHSEAVKRADRTVLHYMQPHAPYLSRGKGQKLKQIRRQEEAEMAPDGGSGALPSLGDTIRPKVESKLEGSELTQKAGLWLELDPADIVRNGACEAALELYEENLRIALKAVADLILELDGRIVVTADHSEAFGEEGIWEHHIETHIPPLMEVPWLKVE